MRAADLVIAPCDHAWREYALGQDLELYEGTFPVLHPH
jgi:hypothetical protein